MNSSLSLRLSPRNSATKKRMKMKLSSADNKAFGVPIILRQKIEIHGQRNQCERTGEETENEGLQVLHHGHEYGQMTTTALSGWSLHRLKRQRTSTDRPAILVAACLISTGCMRVATMLIELSSYQL